MRARARPKPGHCDRAAATTDVAERSRAPHLVVGIGMSAGGIEALTVLLRKMPVGAGLAFVVVSHLDPARESRLVEILARVTRLRVVETGDEMPLEREHVYVLSPDRWMTIERGALHRVKSPLAHGRPIDHFLESLAVECGERAIGVILSGTGSDGTRGARAVKGKGGRVLAQQPASAGFEGMPSSAIAAGAVDDVLTPEEMVPVLIGFACDAAAERDRPPGALAPKRLAHLDHTTRFFRDREAWEALRQGVLAPLVRDQPSGRPIRAWVPGCSTGEEPYTLAILLLEEMAAQARKLEAKIFSTDLIDDVLATGRAGLFGPAIAEDVSAERLRLWFTSEDGCYRVLPAIRSMLIFARQDLAHDPPFSRLDLVCCRNVLTDLEPSVQSRALRLLHFALRDGGVLFLGSGESVGRQARRLFDPIHKRRRVFRKRGAPGQEAFEFSLLSHDGEAIGERLRTAHRHPQRQAPQSVMRQALIDRFAPAAVLIDSRHQVLQFHGDSSEFLGQPAGEPTQNLLFMVRDDLRVELRSALRRASAERSTVSIRAPGAPIGERRSSVLITVMPLSCAGPSAPPIAAAEQLLVVSFQNEPPVAQGAPFAPARPRLSSEQLEQELRRAEDELRSTIDKLATANEDLRAANEKLTSTIQELATTNEELETSREELQSLNEELYAGNEQLSGANEQLQEKLDELEAVTDDLSNLLNSTDIATLFLDRELRVRRFTTAISRLMDLRSHDAGRPIGHFARKFADPALVDDARKVLETSTAIEALVRSDEDHWFLRRIVPYRVEGAGGGDRRIAGVVVTFTDITLRRAAEDSLRRLNEELELQVAQRTALVRLLQDVAIIANSAMPMEQAFESTLERVCRDKEWLAGHAYSVHDGVAEDLGIWHIQTGVDAGKLRAAFGGRAFAAGEWLVGRVLESGEACWSSDVTRDRELQRAGAAAQGVRAALAFPILVGERVVGVLEFLSFASEEPEPRLLEVMRNVGTQLGRVIEREEMRERMIDLAIEEQRSLGEELHDTLSQQVYGLAMLGQSLAQSLSADGGAEPRVRALVDGLQDAHRQIRVLASGLVPVRIEVGGLIEALREMAREWEQMHGTACSFQSEGRVDIEDERVATALYRIAREAARNAVLHGEARRIDIRLAGSGGRLELDVRDDGSGMQEVPAQGPGMGLQIMRHRAELIGGTLEIRSEPGRGTLVRCRIPLARPRVGRNHEA